MTEELNHALILRLASEFQGFARDLHDEAVAAVALYLVPGQPRLQDVVALPYRAGRRLDRGNAEPSGLREDFNMFGVELWTEIGLRHPMRGQQWREGLARLNQARNGVAHDDPGKVTSVALAGWPPTLRSVRRWRGALDCLAGAMDDVLGRHLFGLYGTAPW